MTKVKWLNTDANPLIVCCGGLSVDQEEEHHTVTVVHGADHIALDFTSPVVDFVPVVGMCTISFVNDYTCMSCDLRVVKVAAFGNNN